MLLRILVETVWDLVQAKCSLCWWIEKCGGLVWRCCPRNLQEKVGEEKKKILYCSVVHCEKVIDCNAHCLNIHYF